MTTDDLYGYIIPNYLLCAIVNSDRTNLTDEEDKELDDFCEKVANEHGNANFLLGDSEETDLGFRWRNHVNNLGADCTLMYIRPTQ